MILQALHSYYQRLAAMDDPDAAPEGFAPQSIGFALELGENGELLDVTDLRVQASKGKKLLARKMIVPSLGKKRSSGVEPNFLWDGPGYVLGRDDKGKPARTGQCREAFRKLHEDLLGSVDIPEARALLGFLRMAWANNPLIEEKWQDLATANLVFRMNQRYLHEIPALCAAWGKRATNACDDAENEEQAEGICLVTGERAAIATLHPDIKGVVGAQSSGAALCSYNQDSFLSFGKKQNLNGPVGKSAAFGYTTALNYLLQRPSQRLRLGAASVVCWAERDSPLENNLFALINGLDAGVGNEPSIDLATAEERAGILRRLAQGLPWAEAWPGLDPAVRLYVLSLKPNAARLSVDFFLQGSAEDFLTRIRDNYAHFAIVRRFDNEPEFPSVWQIARAALGKHKDMDDVQRLGGDLIKAALSGQPYPAYLLPMCLQRLRCGDDSTSVRAGIIKALLTRNYDHKENLMSLNPAHPSPAYQLGRLFALLQSVQRKAIGPNINADIRDKYYGAASATPSVVFPLLLRNAQNHISKAKAGGYDKLIRDVLDRIDDAFPAHLDLQDQGLFALGYYHQRAEKAVRQDEESPTASSAAEDAI